MFPLHFVDRISDAVYAVVGELNGSIITQIASRPRTTHWLTDPLCWATLRPADGPIALRSRSLRSLLATHVRGACGVPPLAEARFTLPKLSASGA